MPHIVVLDAHTLNPGDLSWDALQSLGDCHIYDRSSPAEVLSRIAEADLVLTNKTELDRAALAAAPKLRYIGVLATGYNVVDVAAAAERKIIVTNVPAYSTPSVVQTVFALLLELTHHAGEHSQAVHAGQWSACPDFCFWNFPLVELSGLTLGIVGFGHIGQGVAAVASAFGMRVLVSTRRPPADAPAGLTFTDLDGLFAESDVITLHTPLTPQTQQLINADRLSRMKPSAFLINTGRGALIDEPALTVALNAGQIAGAGLDVLSTEPPSPDNPLLTAKNCLITPHIAWATTASRRRLMNAAIENLRAFIAGKPINMVGGKL